MANVDLEKDVELLHSVVSNLQKDVDNLKLCRNCSTGAGDLKLEGFDGVNPIGGFGPGFGNPGMGMRGFRGLNCGMHRPPFGSAPIGTFGGGFNQFGMPYTFGDPKVVTPDTNKKDEDAVYAGLGILLITGLCAAAYKFLKKK